MTIVEAVSKNPQIMSGELCFTGTRVPVRNLFGYIQSGDKLQDFLADFPGVSIEQVTVVLATSLEQIQTQIPLSA